MEGRGAVLRSLTGASHARFPRDAAIRVVDIAVVLALD
jgi:hypothetical protein